MHAVAENYIRRDTHMRDSHSDDNNKDYSNIDIRSGPNVYDSKRCSSIGIIQRTVYTYANRST